ncbi:hypothetical protein, partial [Sinorhizobium medicae]|uniref:hypothetical protein n=1 Tax=Sinorhizobium medicae TaxID=110321 RepID=UPI001AECEC96
GGYILAPVLHIPFLDRLAAAPRGRREPTLWPLSMANGSKSLKRRNKNSTPSCSPMQLAASGFTRRRCSVLVAWVSVGDADFLVFA